MALQSSPSETATQMLQMKTRTRPQRMAMGPPDVRPDARPCAKVDHVPRTQKERASIEIMENLRVRGVFVMWPGCEGILVRGEEVGSEGLWSGLSMLAVVLLLL